MVRWGEGRTYDEVDDFGVEDVQLLEFVEERDGAGEGELGRGGHEAFLGLDVGVLFIGG